MKRSLSEFVAEQWSPTAEVTTREEVDRAHVLWRMARQEYFQQLGEQKPAPLVASSWVEEQERLRAYERIAA
ncbi:hypothetical protein GCM10010313_20580 [Streptomyces violarus]|uniref:Uncharacterized protein n=1 Tax=Streptomyces violarus TaxID=67380 RepID=A0A7W4ZN52_9ACTN|nr:hypothetical protein [Streptomyces violarus]GHD04370.1 hypothetical protein GCM10010313_20580 [Streptomyces violarus]